MEREEAIEFLRDRCFFEPRLGENQCLEIWNDYRHRVEALEERRIAVPRRRMLTPQEGNWERRFLDFVHSNGSTNVRSLIKVNLMELVVHQKIILTARSADYAARLLNAGAWRELALPVSQQQFNYQTAYRNMGSRAEVDMDIPDGEWFLVPSNCRGEFHLRAAPALRHVTVTQPEPDRMLLWAGYHRSYARALRDQPDGMESPALVALAENVVSPPIAGNETPFDRLVRGLRPPFFGDFFDDRLFIRVDLLRRRPQMRIRSEIAWIDDP
jgi:hypothetical protein